MAPRLCVYVCMCVCVRHEGAQKPKTPAKSNGGLKALDSPNKLIGLRSAFEVVGNYFFFPFDMFSLFDV